MPRLSQPVNVRLGSNLGVAPDRRAALSLGVPWALMDSRGACLCGVQPLKKERSPGLDTLLPASISVCLLTGLHF